MNQDPNELGVYSAPQEDSRISEIPSFEDMSANEQRPPRQPRYYASTDQGSPYAFNMGSPIAPDSRQRPNAYGAPASYGQQNAAARESQSAQAVRSRNKQGGSAAWPITLVICIALICTAVIFSTISCTSTMNNALSSVGLGTTQSVEDSSPKIGVISIASSISYDGTECSPTGLKKLLDKAAADDSIKGIILWVNSGGGTATAGEEMAAAVREFEKPIVVVSGATNASAAYEISSQADRIYVAKTTAIGSIGVVLQVTDLSGLYDMLGIKIDNITSTDSKDATYGSRPLTEEERAWYQKMVDQISDDFIATVAAGRDMSLEDVNSLANGLTYTGTEAVENGLADEIGYLDDAVAYLSEVAGYSQPLKAHALYLSSSTNIADLISILGQDDVDYLTGTLSKPSVEELPLALK